MNSDLLSNSVMDQINRALHMFRKAVLALPAEEWRKGDSNYLRPAGSAYHVVETLHFYTSNLPANQFPWGQRFSVDWEDPDSTKLPSQAQVLEYLDETWANAQRWIAENDLLHSEPLYPWTGSTLHSRMLYVLRHIQHHTAEIALELGKRGFEAPEWE